MVHTIDSGTMQEVAAAIDTGPLVGLTNAVHPESPNWRHATLSADERYLVLNRGRAPEVTVADLVDRRAWTLPLAADVAVVGGVALGRAEANLGLLAVHAETTVQVYRFDPYGPLVELARLSIGVPVDVTTSED